MVNHFEEKEGVEIEFTDGNGCCSLEYQNISLEMRIIMKKTC